MKIWHFSEQAYHPAWGEPAGLRVNFPQYHCDPVEAGQLLNRYLDEYCLADELGLNIMVNEHHATATCMSTSVMTTLAILARETSKARLLALGIPLANRANPMRVAEEVALADCLSGGRIEMGLVKGVPLEVIVSNRQPTQFMDRFWEAHDLIIAAMSNLGETFSWEGEHYHIRTSALWPRPVQQPHPPVWGTASSASSARMYGARGYTCATFLSGAVARSVFTGYRDAYIEAFGKQPSADRLGYLAVVACASDRKEAYRRAEEMRKYFLAAPRFDAPFRNVMGFNPVEANLRALTAGASAMRPRLRNGEPLGPDASVEDYVSAQLMFVGTPDDVYEQLAQFNVDVGGFGNLLMMGQAGELSHADTADSLTLIAKEVAPRLAEMPDVSPLEVRYEGVG
ncbi:LLM class flavin-dependent oxidoreductase [Sphingobium nicotianae]|uniref:LLM class flavin-dependent oxidoreductase n=1 Tax=Sphingobium nicotianae TaxID=2782607 RepID=A0A9X1IPT3_9SPHN|nr:LLM class flavin-dependent oxidoreductase [Sphingobium nicotianae]MBT2186328.1 LLM class flavin-dependent oxidoreductase [Sphingobium nicotianae]